MMSHAIVSPKPRLPMIYFVCRAQEESLPHHFAVS